MDKWLFWDPDPICFTLPGIGHPIAWYGVIFALGFFIGFYLLRSLFKQYLRTCTDWGEDELKKKSMAFSEKLTVYVIIATVVGARLGHILFYEKWSDYFLHPLDIVKTWEGGLASHGGVVGILLGIIIFYFRMRKEFPFLTVRRIIDMLIVPALLVGTFIRIGNFVNQEILGTVSTVPWAIVFGHPIDGSAPVPRHPVQLYEAAFYCLAFLGFWKFFPRLLYPAGRLAGLFFVLIFGFRFLVEYFKEEQSFIFGSDWITMGQILSIPLIIFGFILLFRKGQEEQAGLKAF